MKKAILILLTLITLSFSSTTYVRLVNCDTQYGVNGVKYVGLYKSQNGEYFTLVFNNQCPIRYEVDTFRQQSNQGNI